ncbi:sarcosine oxidase subunit gamma [Rhodobacteraceae bacterium KMM 6894]|nr:sarcosine oxidase subunit gamma [Rhodobacteraceae bacterium KMM 6894]
MSNTVSALNGARATGFAEVREMGLYGMITLRGDLSGKKLIDAAKSAGGTNVPEKGHITLSGAHGIAWMSPDELLILTPYDEVDARLDGITEKLAGTHHLAVNVSDARAIFAVSGKDALVREALSKLCPVNFSADAFAHGQFRRTRMAQVPAAVWLPQPGEARVICFRSVAQYAFDLLKGATAEGGEVGYLA